MRIRSPARDQPSPEETEQLVASLRRSVEDAARRKRSMIYPSSDRSQQVRVLLEGAQAEVTLVEHGQVLAERTVDAAWLLQLIERDGQRFEVLAEVAQQ